MKIAYKIKLSTMRNLINNGLKISKMRALDFRDADFENTDFEDADFKNADFKNAKFKNVNFQDVNFQDVNFKNAVEFYPKLFILLRTYLQNRKHKKNRRIE